MGAVPVQVCQHVSQLGEVVRGQVVQGSHGVLQHLQVTDIIDIVDIIDTSIDIYLRSRC